MTTYTLRVATGTTGTGLDETAEVTFVAPSNAVQLNRLRGHIHGTAPSAAESGFGVFKVRGQDWKHSPYEFFSEIMPGKLGTVDQVGYEREPRWWNAYLPIVPGGTYAVTYEPLDAMAADGRFDVDVEYSTIEGGGEPMQRLASRETATSTATGPTITISGAAKVVEYTIGVAPSTVAADDPSDGLIAVTSSGLVGQQTFNLSFNVHSIEAISGVASTSLFQAPQDIDVEAETLVITSAITVTTALTTAGAYAYAIGYRPKKVAAPR